MNLENCIWNKKTYQEFKNYLYTLKDPVYFDFHAKLIREKETLIGIRTPILKEIAKKISKNNPFDFLKLVEHDTYEETLIHGLILGYLKIDFINLVDLLDSFLPFIHNWAVNDITCANLKVWKTHLDEGYPIILNYLKNSNPWIVRFGLVLLLDFYVNDTYIDSILKLCPTIKGDNYYVGMANAWLLSICYIHYPEKTLHLLKQNILDDFTQRHALQKIIESTRVTKEQKEYIKTLKNTHLGKSLI